MRLTADGKMKNCLFSKSETDVLTAYRNGENIVALIHQNIHEKKQALGGQFTTDMDKIEINALHNRTMISIGG
jgi:cyclic pyranopterin phosphate synthase